MSKTYDTTQIGYVNPKEQEVVENTGRPGTDHGQTLYRMRCRECGQLYEVNGTNAYECLCPNRAAH